MNTTITQNVWRLMAIFLLVLLFQNQTAQGAATVNMYTDQCASGSNYFEFRLMITNTSTAGETLYIQAPGTWRINHGAAIVPSGTNTYSLTYIANSADPSLAPLFATLGTTYNTSYTASSRLMQATFSTSVLGNSAAATNAPLLPGNSMSAGKFRLTITNTNFVSGATASCTWVTTSGIVAYINTNTSATAMNTTTFRTLGTLCSSTIPAGACTVSATATGTAPSCFGRSDGSATVTATGSSPFTYLWSNGATTSTASGLSAGSYTVTVTGTGGCTTTASATVNAGTQPQQPTLACYQTATFNSTTCQWDVTGTQPQQPTLACYQSATFNNTTCEWDVTGTQPSAPTNLSCWQTATFNNTTCQWDVTGTQPQQPTLACYQSATFNNTTCQ
ncbi:MAG: SprB repeat-containing protein, partial [Bacteroidota bacterium]